MDLSGRAFGGMAARNGATLTGESISSVAARTRNVSGTIGGEIADRSLGNYMPQMQGHHLKDTQITGGTYQHNGHRCGRESDSGRDVQCVPV